MYNESKVQTLCGMWMTASIHFGLGQVRLDNQVATESRISSISSALWVLQIFQFSYLT